MAIESVHVCIRGVMLAFLDIGDSSISVGFLMK